MNLPLRSIAAMLAVAALCGPGRAQTWDAEVVAVAARIPVQDDGRVKPLSTLARFKLLRYSGGQSLRLENPATGKTRKLGPTEWVLDCLFFPERAKGYPTFEVARYEIVDALELPHDGKRRRDWYSFDELEPGFDKLFEHGRRYQKIERQQRTALQEQILRLAQSVADFGRLTGYLDCVRDRYAAAGDELGKLFGGEQEVTLSAAIEQAPALADLYGREADAGAEHAAGHGKRTPVHELITTLLARAEWSNAIAMFPPAVEDGADEPWLTLGTLIEKSFRRRTPGLATQYRQVARLETLAAAREDPSRFRAELEALESDLASLAAARGQYDTVPLEVAYYDSNLLFWAQGLYLLGFLVVALLWFFPNSRALARIAWGSLWVPTGCLVAAITMRCMIRGRPPVSTLYETILFITAVAAVVLLLVELVNRQRIAVSLAAVLGAAGMFLAHRYELSEQADTMPTLVAVLDTNFWLATHVTCVVTGYSASLLAAAIAHVWLVGKAFVFVRDRLRGTASTTGPFFRNVARMFYGTICFGLLFSLVGTILGGIWANDSWGRFWGWDPKENGALMICLWELAILHARLGGYIRHFGQAMAGVVLGMITVFSWWHVNQLGEGLHSYGFTEGVMRNLWTYYSIELGILGTGLVTGAVLRRRRRVAAPVGGGVGAVAARAREPG